MRILMEQWRKFLSEGVADLEPISTGKWSAEDAKQEWVEEIESSFDEGDEYIEQRWPGLTREKIKKDYPFLETPEEFAQALSAAETVSLTPGEMKDIHNHAQVYDIIEMYENGATEEEVEEKMMEDFSGKTTDPNAEGETFSKEGSYQRWVEHFKDSDEAPKPPIVMKLPDGRYAHVGGQTRQSGALTNKKIIPYAVLSAEVEEKE